MGVYTRPDSPYFWLRIEQPDGQPPRRISTHLLAQGLTPEQRAENRRFAQQLYLKKVTDATARAHGLIDGRDRMRFDDYAAWYETHIATKNRGAARELDILKVLRTHFGACMVHEIDRERTREYMTARLVRGINPRTVNREIDVLKSMLREACPKYLQASPLVGMRRLKTVAPRRHYMTEDEEDRLIRVLRAERDHVGLALLFLGIDSLGRLGDLLDLRREDDHGRYAWIQDPKDPGQAKPYTIPISRRARVALDAIATTGSYYFARFRVAKNPRDWGSSVRQWLEKACARATPPIPYGRTKGGVTFHWATRRTGASRMLRDGVDLKSVQRVGNWKSAELVLDIYSETFDERAAQAVEVPGRRRKGRPSRHSGGHVGQKRAKSGQKPVGSVRSQR